MINGNKIKGRIVELQLDQSYLAKEIGIAQPTLSQKLQGIRPTSLAEAKVIKEVLQIPDSELCIYFFV